MIQDKTQFQGFKLPRFLQHGTTESFVDGCTEKNGIYKVYFPFIIDAIDGDSRGWPKHLQPDWKRATVVIDTDKAYEGLQSTFSYAHFRFSYLPAGSFRTIRESEINFKVDMFGSDPAYVKRLEELKRELLENRLVVR